jgi:hypothetical protein
MSRRYAAVLFLALPFFALACGGDDGGDDIAPDASTGQSEPGRLLTEPPAAYAPAVEELAGFFSVQDNETYGLSAGTFASLGPFDSRADGERLADEWGYDSGFRVIFQPDGLLAGVLEGRFFATIMIHEFETTQGAQEAFAHYKTWSDGRAGSEKEEAPDLGNESGAWSIVLGTVGNTEMETVYHRVVIRRGNIIADILTEGGKPFMTIDQAAGLAQIFDERATGTRPAEMPTPVAAPTSPAF